MPHLAFIISKHVCAILRVAPLSELADVRRERARSAI